MTKVTEDEISNCLELLESRIDPSRLYSYAAAYNPYAPSLAFNNISSSIVNKELPCQELKLFQKAQSALKPLLTTGLHDYEPSKQINLFPQSQAIVSATVATSTYRGHADTSYSRADSSNYERSRVFGTSRPTASQNYPVYTSTHAAQHQSSYHHHQYSHYSNLPYAERDYRSRNTVGNYSSESTYKHTSRSILTQVPSYSKYTSTNYDSSYHNTSAYVPSSATAIAATSSTHYDSYSRNLGVSSSRTTASGLLSARLNTSVDSGLGLQTRLGHYLKK